MKPSRCPECGSSACVIPSDSESVPLLERGRADFYCTDCAAPFWRRVSFSAIYGDVLERLIKERSCNPFPIQMHPTSRDYQVVSSAINQGIDSHLEAVRFQQMRGDGGRTKIVIEAPTLHVLVRRLMESDDEQANSLASDICESLNIELI